MVLSKRKPSSWCEETRRGLGRPRSPTLVEAARGTRRAVSPFAERIGVSKNDSLIDYVLFEDAMREVMNESDQRRVAVLDPLKLIIDNYPAGQVEECLAPNHLLHPELGQRPMPSPGNCGSRRGFPGSAEKRIPPALSRQQGPPKYGYIVECTGCDKDETAGRRRAAPTCPTQIRHAGSRQRQGQGHLHWVSWPTPTRPNPPLRPPVQRLRPRRPGAKGDGPEVERNFLDDLNPPPKPSSPPS